MTQTLHSVAIGSDHAGYALKEIIKKYLSDLGHAVRDYGTDSEESADYPDYIHPLAEAVDKGEYAFGIIMCGSGNGASMTANKHRGVRAALCWTPEIAYLARAHNDANVLALPARFIEEEEALETVHIFLTAGFEGGRHHERVRKIAFNKT